MHSIQTAEDIVKLLCPIILVFLLPAQVPNSPSVGTQNIRGEKILRFSTEIAVYLGNGTRPTVDMER